MAQRVDIQYVQFYTSGSAAKCVAPLTPVQTGTLPRTTKRRVRRVYVDPVAILGSAVAVCMLVMMLVGLSNLRAEQAKTAEMVAYVAQLQDENAALHARFEAECDLEQIEETARALGMVPREDVEHIAIDVELPPVEEEQPLSLWERIGTFLTGLFA